MTTKQIKPIDEVRVTVKSMTPQFEMALPKNIDSEKFQRVLMTTIQNTPKLLDCNRVTLYSAAMKCAQDGLLPDGREAALIPYGSTCQYMPMVAGICKKARNSGEIGTMDAVIVYENDEYESYTDETGPHFKHVRARTDRGEPILAFAYAVSKDKFLYFEEMSREEIEAVRDHSGNKKGPWGGPFQYEMWRKTVLRRLAKYKLPSSADLDDFIRREAEEFYAQTEAAAEPNPAPQTSSRLSKIVNESQDTAPNDAGEPPPPSEPQILDENDVPI